MKLILGKKLGMTQKYDTNGDIVPLTIVQAGPCKVTQIKSLEKDKYKAVQLGFSKAKKLKKPQAKHLDGIETNKYLKEFRASSKEEITLKKGDVLNVSQFQEGDKVKVTGTTKGRGFQGVVKRHRFHGSPATHGHKDQLRMPGSIGERSFPGKVFRGMKMGGHMGNVTISVRNVRVFAIDTDKNLLYLKGAVPGANNGLLIIYG